MKIVLVAPDDFSIWVFRRGLIEQLKKLGHEVYIISSIGRYASKLASLGVEHLPVNIERFISPINDCFVFLKLYKLFRSHKFDIVHNFTIKPNIYGSLAGKIAGVRNIFASVTGLGILFSDSFEGNAPFKILHAIAKGLYLLAARCCTRIWFQNSGDLDFFVAHRFITPEKAILIKGSGVNLKEFNRNAVDEGHIKTLKKLVGDDGSNLYVTMVTRILRNKGVLEFIRASEIVMEKYPKVKFLLVGGLENENPLAVSEEYLKKKKGDAFVWLGFRDDIKEIQALSDISVSASYYPEGIPKSLLEAMAMGNPVIATNHVGCREVVEHGKNGYLIPIKDPVALGDSIENLINNPNKCKEFGEYSRKKAENEFDEKIVVNRIITELYGIRNR